MAEHQENILADYNKAVSQHEGTSKSVNGVSEKDVLVFDFLKDHAAILMAHTFDFDWNVHVSKLFQSRDFIVSEILDADVVELIILREKDTVGLCNKDTNPSMVCRALLMTSTVNRNNVDSG